LLSLDDLYFACLDTIQITVQAASSRSQALAGIFYGYGQGVEQMRVIDSVEDTK
jgi:hypothetical protein